MVTKIVSATAVINMVNMVIVARCVASHVRLPFLYISCFVSSLSLSLLFILSAHDNFTSFNSYTGSLCWSEDHVHPLSTLLFHFTILCHYLFVPTRLKPPIRLTTYVLPYIRLTTYVLQPTSYHLRLTIHTSYHLRLTTYVLPPTS